LQQRCSDCLEIFTPAFQRPFFPLRFFSSAHCRFSSAGLSFPPGRLTDRAWPRQRGSSLGQVGGCRSSKRITVPTLLAHVNRSNNPSPFYDDNNLNPKKMRKIWKSREKKKKPTIIQIGQTDTIATDSFPLCGSDLCSHLFSALKITGSRQHLFMCFDRRLFQAPLSAIRTFSKHLPLLFLTEERRWLPIQAISPRITEWSFKLDFFSFHALIPVLLGLRAQDEDSWIYIHLSGSCCESVCCFVDHGRGGMRQIVSF